MRFHAPLAVLGAVALMVGAAGCASGPPDTVDQSGAQSGESAQSGLGREVTVTVDGEGVATDVTITVTDGSQSGSQQSTRTNVELPYRQTLEVEAGSRVQVAAQNGTSGGGISATVRSGDTTTAGRSQSGDSAVATVESEVR
jgi:hypothetical protein